MWAIINSKLYFPAQNTVAIVFDTWRGLSSVSDGKLCFLGLLRCTQLPTESVFPVHECFHWFISLSLIVQLLPSYFDTCAPAAVHAAVNFCLFIISNWCVISAFCFHLWQILALHFQYTQQLKLQLTSWLRMLHLSGSNKGPGQTAFYTI